MWGKSGSQSEIAIKKSLWIKWEINFYWIETLHRHHCTYSAGHSNKMFTKISFVFNSCKIVFNEKMLRSLFFIVLFIIYKFMETTFATRVLFSLLSSCNKIFITFNMWCSFNFSFTKKKNNIGLSVSMDYNIKKMSITPSHLTCLLILFFRAILWTLAVRELFILKLS